MFSRPRKKSNVLMSGQQQWMRACAPSRLVRLHFVAAVDPKKADGRVRFVSARTALHARAGAKVARETPSPAPNRKLKGSCWRPKSWRGPRAATFDLLAVTVDGRCISCASLMRLATF